MVPPVPVARTSSTNSSYNASQHKPLSRNNSSRGQPSQPAPPHYDYDNLNYESFLAATAAKPPLRTSNTHPNISSAHYLPSPDASTAIKELSNLIADSNILIPVNTVPRKPAAEEKSGSRSRSQGPVVLEKKSLDKFLKLASNSASLLDLNQQQQQSTSSASLHLSNSKLKTSSGNLLAVCGVENANAAKNSWIPPLEQV